METLPAAGAESPLCRRALLALALAAAALFLLATQHYWVPADPNADENAYLVSGKLLARTGSPGFAPPDPYSFVGMMWISTPEGRFYPKYPLGQTLLVAAAVGLAGPRAAFLINPLLMTLGLCGVFLLIRDAAGSLAGLLGMLAMAASPVLLAETNDPDSHAGSVCFTAWGMFLLFRWWRDGQHRQAALAGLLLGLAAITRYTDGLFLLPMGLVALFRLGRRWDRRRLAGAALLAAGWLLPVAGQLAFNLRVLHRFTGYGATHESTAFSLDALARHGLEALRQLSALGLPLLFPLGVVGLLLLTLRDRRLGLALWAWTLPNLLLYMSYYWAPDDLTYTRFFLSIFPPLALAAAWLLTRPLPGPSRLRRLQPAVAIVLVLACGAFGVREILPMLTSIHQEQEQAWRAGVATLAAAPPGSAVFGPQQALSYLQYAGDGYRLYSRLLFVPRTIARMGRVDPRQPSSLQPERARALYKLLKGRKSIGLLKLQRELAAASLGQGLRVFLIVPAGDPEWLRFADPQLTRVDDRSFVLRPVAHWSGWGLPVNERGDRKPMAWELLEATSGPAAGS